MLVSKVPRFILYDKTSNYVTYIDTDRKVVREQAEIEIVVPEHYVKGYIPYTVISNKTRKMKMAKLSNLYRDISFATINILVAYGREWDEINDNIKVMAFDIEVGTTGGEPVPEKNKILTIGYAIDDGDVEILYTNNKAADSDKVIIKKFIDVLIKERVGIITGYYSSGFDIPYIIRRAYSLGMLKDVMRLAGKFDILKSYINNCIFTGSDVSSSFGVILHHDIFRDVKRDQSLGKIKHKTMKEVGRYLLKDYIDSGKIKILEMDREEMPEMQRIWDSEEGKRRILEYQASDVEVQRLLSNNIYTSRLVNIANSLQVPLNIIFDMRPSTLLQIDLLRRLRSKGMMITSNNKKKFAFMYKRAKDLGSKNPYQGAWTEAFERGIYDNIKKYDYSSLYPSIIDTFNLSYETTEIDDIEYLDNMDESDINKNKMDVERDSDSLLVTIYDENQKAYIRIRIDMSKRGIIPDMISDYRTMRRRIKKKMKEYEEGTSEYIKYDSEQQAIKILNNSIYGLISNTNMGGWLPAGILTTAIGRWLARNMVEFIRKEGAQTIELDSVTGDTPIWIKDNDRIYITRIDELVPDNEEGIIKVDGLETWTRNGWKKITYIKKHKVKKAIYRVEISDGYVDVTEDHSLFDIDRNIIKPGEIVERKTELELSTIPDISTTGVIINPISNDYEFTWLIGFTIAKGTMYKYLEDRPKYKIKINGSNRDVIEHVMKLYSKYISRRFGCKLKLYNATKSSNIYEITGCCSTRAGKYILSLTYTKDGKTKKVPDYVLTDPGRYGKAFIDGLFAGYGYNTTNEYILDMKSKVLAAGVRILMSKMENKAKTHIGANNNVVLQNRKIYESKEIYVYDIATDDGTFVTPLGDIVLHNTDGVLVSGSVDVNKLNDNIRSTIKNKFGISEKKISVEVEEEVFNKVLMYKAKNYILQEKDGEYPIIHGSALKSSKHARVMDRMIEIIVDYAIFGNKTREQAIEEIMDIEGLSIEYFIMSTTFTKDISKYKTENELVKEARRLEKYGETVGDGYTIDYVMVINELTGKPEPYSVVRMIREKNKPKVYYDYYREQMKTVLEEMGIISKSEDVKSDDILDMFT